MASTLTHDLPTTALLRDLLGVFKLRIGFAITLTALAGAAITSGPPLNVAQALALCFAILISSAAAGAFNQLYERDIDSLMRRTQARPFARGRFGHRGHWLLSIVALLLLAVFTAWRGLNAWAALFVFLGAFFYGVIYTVWLKRRTCINIVVGGLAGSWAVLAGAAAVGAPFDANALALALVLFLWTPPHFWSLAIAYQKDYADANIPMLPVVIGDRRAGRAVLIGAVALLVASLLPWLHDLGAIYLVGALGGGLFFVVKAAHLAAAPSRATAMASFHASLAQLSLLLLAIALDTHL